MTQGEMILDYLKKHDSITPYDAIAKLGITKLATRISELRLEEGWEFDIEMETSENRFGKPVRYARYSNPRRK